jgi:hypothetical protein
VANTTEFESCQVVALSGLRSDLKKSQTKATNLGCGRLITGSRSEKYAALVRLNGDLFYMSISLEPLKITALPLHRFWFKLFTQEQWYAVMHECRNLYGHNWAGQRHVLKGFRKVSGYSPVIQKWMQKHSPQVVWFEVPDPNFATWATVKFSIEVADNPNKFGGK